MVSKASEDLPEPERPVNTIRRSRGSSRSMFCRLCVRAPRIRMKDMQRGSWAGAAKHYTRRSECGAKRKTLEFGGTCVRRAAALTIGVGGHGEGLQHELLPGGGLPIESFRSREHAFALHVASLFLRSSCMARGVNKVILIGHLGADPETK